MSEEIRRIKLVKPANTNEADSESGRERRSAEARGDKDPVSDLATQRLSNMGKQADVLQSLINELKSMSNLAQDTAVREGGSVRRIDPIKEADPVESTARLKGKEEAIEARELALIKLEEASNAKFEQIEKQLEERKVQLDNRESELGRLAARVRGVVDRLNQTESEHQSNAERLEGKVAELRRQLKEKDETLAAKNLELEKLGGELQSREAELKEKEKLVQAAAANEAEIGKLIARLSSECERLSSELERKNGAGARAEKKENGAASDGPIWKKILGRINDQ